MEVHFHYIFCNLKKDKRNVDIAPPWKNFCGRPCLKTNAFHIAATLKCAIGYKKKHGACNAFLSAVSLDRRFESFPCTQELHTTCTWTSSCFGAIDHKFGSVFFSVSGWTCAGYRWCQFTKCWPTVDDGPPGGRQHRVAMLGHVALVTARYFT